MTSLPLKPTCIALLLLLLMQSCRNETPLPVIDMHAHSYSAGEFTPQQPGKDYYGRPGAVSEEAHRLGTFNAFREWHVVKAVVSGNPESVARWADYDMAGIVIKGLLMFAPDDYGMDSVKLEQMIRTGDVQVFGEIGPYYSGTTLSDSAWQPYLRLWERYDIPVAVHTGGGEPDGTYTWSPKARLRLGDPYLIEDVLVRYPKLRVYLMHNGGEEWHEHALRLMAYYPQLYTDIAVMLWVEPNTQRTVTDFLRNAKHAGYLDRVMFGSDQMRWPEAVGQSIEFLLGLSFLTREEKAGILYDNAARFLRIGANTE